MGIHVNPLFRVGDSTSRPKLWFLGLLAGHISVEHDCFHDLITSCENWLSESWVLEKSWRYPHLEWNEFHDQTSQEIATLEENFGPIFHLSGLNRQQLRKPVTDLLPRLPNDPKCLTSFNLNVETVYSFDNADIRMEVRA